MTYTVSMWEDGRLIEVRVKAPSASKATRKAEALCPDAVHLTTTRYLRSGAA